MWLPIEIVNMIMDFAGTGQYLQYCYKTNMHKLRYNPEHDRFQFLSNLFKDISIQHNGNETQFQYVIPLRRVPSVTSRIHNINTIQNIMSINVVEQDTKIITEYYTTVVIETSQSALLL